MANDVMIEAKGLTKEFGAFRALDKVSFEVKKGEVVGFLGPNGAGKSTTMRILTCFISASAGRARVHGIDSFDDPLEVRRKIGYLPQRAPLYGEMSVWDYLRFCSEMRGLDFSTFRSRMKKIVEVCGLARVLGKDIRTLSHGYRQRVGLGQALIHDPPILILDEPTSDLDPNERAEVVRYIQETGRNRTILLSTHNLNEVEAVCKRAIIVSKGRVVADGALDEIRSVSGKVRYVVSVDGSRGLPGTAYRGGGGPPSAQELHTELRNISGVSSVRELPAGDAAGIVHRLELRGSDKGDLRGDIYQLAVQKGWMLVHLGREAESLEEAFKSLTKDDERADRGARGGSAGGGSAFTPIEEEEEEEEDEEDVHDEDDVDGADDEETADEEPADEADDQSDETSDQDEDGDETDEDAESTDEDEAAAKPASSSKSAPAAANDKKKDDL